MLSKLRDAYSACWELAPLSRSVPGALQLAVRGAVWTTPLAVRPASAGADDELAEVKLGLLELKRRAAKAERDAEAAQEQLKAHREAKRLTATEENTADEVQPAADDDDDLVQEQMEELRLVKETVKMQRREKKILKRVVAKQNEENEIWAARVAETDEKIEELAARGAEKEKEIEKLKRRIAKVDAKAEQLAARLAAQRAPPRIRGDGVTNLVRDVPEPVAPMALARGVVVEPEELASHSSLRRGGCDDVSATRVSHKDRMAHGRWSSNTMDHYLR